MRQLPLQLRALGAIAACAAVSGCSFLAPQPDPSRFFTLSALPEAYEPHTDEPRRGTGSMQGLSYGLGPIKFPAYLDRNEIVTRLSSTEIVYSPTDRWAEPLKANVAQVVLENLSAILDTDRIALFPWTGDVKFDYRIEIALLRFESAAAGDTQVTARWAIKDGHTGAFLFLKETKLTRSAAGGTPASVGALSDALGELSQEIATALQTIHAQRPAKPAARKRS